jgi:8-hydroxy-5-deazaflavin:NADPH oxidoreductase
VTAYFATGHTVKIGSSSWEKVESEAAKHGKKDTAGNFADAAAFEEIVVIATLWEETPRAIMITGEENFARKAVIDVTDPFEFSKSMPPTLAITYTDSGGKTV